MKLSQWHDGSVKPVHVGVYERATYDDEIKFSCWNGDNWMLSCSTVSEAYSLKDSKLALHMSVWQKDIDWRGIVKDKK